MAIPKEPRQRMINIMYLVLIILLALNVSAEVLKAFGDINTSLEASTKGLDTRIEGIKSDFSIQMNVDPKKTKSYYDKAIEVSENAEDLSNWIERTKKEMIEEAGGINDNGVIDNAKDTDIASRLMLPENEAKAIDLKKRIQMLKDLVEQAKLEFDLGSQVNLNKLNTDDVSTSDGPQKWEVATFNSLPVVAAVARLSQIQNNIKSVEANVLSGLLVQINQKAYKFDQLETLVIPRNGNILTDGESFEADIFLSAYNSTTKPKIRIGKLKQEVQPDTNGRYASTGVYPLSNIDHDTLTTIKGKGNYVVPSIRQLGKTVKEGCIEVPDPNTGAPVYWPFSFSYVVNKSSAVVSADKMNVLYIGVDNPISVSVPGYPSSKISTSISNGSLAGSNGNYIAKVPGGRQAKVSIYVDENETRRKVGEQLFRVKKIPDPIATLGGKERPSGNIKTHEFKAQRGIIALLKNFDFEYRFTIKSFDTYFMMPRKTAQSFKCSSAAFTQEMITTFQNATVGTIVTFTNIKVRGPQGETRNLSSMTLVCN